MELRDAIEGRRSCRRYSDRPVDRDLLEDLIRTAVWAPSALNVQPWHFKAYVSEKDRGRILAVMEEAARRFMPKLQQRFEAYPEVVKETQTFITTLGRAPVCVFVFLNKEYGERHYTDMLQSAAAAVQNFCLLAHECGLATCWLTGIRAAEELIREQFGENLGQFVAMLTLGYAEPSTPVVPPRKQGRYAIID